MIGLTILAASIGFLLGFAQYRVAVLLPAFLALSVSVWMLSGMAGLDGWRVVLAIVLGVIGLQAGYCLAIAGRAVRRTTAMQSKPSALGVSRFG